MTTRIQKLNRQFEDILRKLYAATDVKNLLDTIPDIKEIVRAGSISLYLIEDSEGAAKTAAVVPSKRERKS